MTRKPSCSVDPLACSCFSGTQRFMICHKVKWSTLSICTACLIIIIYLSSGLYALIDVITMMSAQSTNFISLQSIKSSSWATMLCALSVLVYFTIVVSVTVLLCGIQLGKPWLTFAWSIIMIFMLLADGTVTVFLLQEYQKQHRRTGKEIRILFFAMIVRLIVSSCAIFVTVFYFRHFHKALSEQINRQRMLDRYNSESSSLSYYGSWAHSANLSNPSKGFNDHHDTFDIPPPIPLPRAKFATLQRLSTSTMIDARSQHAEYIARSSQRTMKHYQNDFRYNVPLQERFHQLEMSNARKF